MALGLRFLAAVLLAAVSSGLQVAAAETGPQVAFSTSHGNFRVELFPEQAPATAARFLEYVDRGFYEGLIFHRVIPGFIVQTGGYTAELKAREPGESLPNESLNGPRNERGTLAMARFRNPDSARAQFFVNLSDNASLDAQGERPGYTVFGRVLEGLEHLDAIAEQPTEKRDGLRDVPETPVVIERVERVTNAAHP